MDSQPTIFHITHHKAGSQWVREILKYCAPERFVPPKVHKAHFLLDPIKPGKIYPTVYVPRQRFLSVLSPLAHVDIDIVKQVLRRPDAVARNWFNFQVKRQPYRAFIVLRDLRDTLVSLYFSLKVSHPLIKKDLHSVRATLNQVDKEEGLIYLMDSRLHEMSDIQSSWQDNDALCIRYEALIADEHAIFEQIVDYCQIDVSRHRLHEIVGHNTFEAVTGRKRGQEDVNAHRRKGIAGDWRNHFSDRVKAAFKQRFGHTLIKTGYENDLNW